MAGQTSGRDRKEKRKAPRNRAAAVHPIAAREAIVSPAEIDTRPESPVAFDPRILLTKVSRGKTTLRFEANAPVFSQGDAADSVFYVENGKVKLTVVPSEARKP